MRLRSPKHAGSLRQPRRGDHAPAHGFPMQVGAVVGGRFKCVGKRVTEIQTLAQAGFAFVASHDTGLGADAAHNRKIERCRFSRRQTLDIFLEERKKPRITDDPVFDYFIEPGREFPLRQRSQRLGIGQHKSCRVERSDQVLPFRQIHTGLASDGAVHLRHQRRGDVHEPDSAQVGGRHEARHVPGDSASRRNEQGAPVGTRANQFAAQPFRGGHILGALPVIEEQRGAPIGAAKAGLKLRSPVPSYSRRGQEEQSGVRAERLDLL